MTMIQENAAGFLVKDPFYDRTSFVVLHPDVARGNTPEREKAFRAIPRRGKLFKGGTPLEILMWFVVGYILNTYVPATKDLPLHLFMGVTFLLVVSFNLLKLGLHHLWYALLARPLRGKMRVLQEGEGPWTQKDLILLTGAFLALQPHADDELALPQEERLDALHSTLWEAAAEDLPTAERAALLQEALALVDAPIRSLVERGMKASDPLKALKA